MKILPLAVSSPFNLADYAQGKAWAEAQGHTLIAEPKLRQTTQSYLNGSDAERLQELVNAFTNKQADLIWAARGGYGMTRLLPSLSHEAPQVPVVGFSDMTALMMHLWKHRQIKSIHAPMLTLLHKEPSESLRALQQILQGHARDVNYPNFLSHGQSNRRIQGSLLAANLSMLVELLGTPSMPDLTDSILVLEDCGEKPYRLDRMMTHLFAAKALRDVKAVVIGHLTDCGENPEQVFLERCATFGIPCFTGLSVGHEAPNWPIPVGVQAEIQTNGEAACLKVLEEIF